MQPSSISVLTLVQPAVPMSVDDAQGSRTQATVAGKAIAPAVLVRLLKPDGSTYMHLVQHTWYHEQYMNAEFLVLHEAG